MARISILGCGWLGLPLAKNLLEEGHQVTGSTTSESKLTLLEREGIKPFQIELQPNGIVGDIENFLSKADVLIIDFPPKLRSGQGESFVDRIRHLITHIEKAAVPGVVFVSSTSVYGNVEGLVDEATQPAPTTASGIQLLEAEQLLLSNPNFHATVLRFGGLVGPNRHPVYYLAGRTQLEDPEAPINLIHLDDCIGLVSAILNHGVTDAVFNGVSPFHPTRKTYYTQKAAAWQLDIPSFAAQTKATGKIINSAYVERLLGFHFSVTDQL